MSLSFQLTVFTLQKVIFQEYDSSQTLPTLMDPYLYLAI